MKQTRTKRILSILLSVLLAVSGTVPAFAALADDDGVVNQYNLQIFYEETGTMVPTYQEDGETEYIEYIVESSTVQFTYQLINRTMPDNATVKWYSQNPVLVDVDQTGKVKAFDSSKGAVVQSWIDNEVKTIPIIGSALGKVFEKALFNDYVDLDSMDTEEIVDLVIKVMGEESFMADYIEAYQGTLVSSLREYLDKVNTPIYCQLYDSEGNLLSEDHVNVTVTKNDHWAAQFLPNGTHITNKSQIKTTQAVGNTVQLYAITTPQRLHYGTVYSVKSSSIFTQGKVVATVNDSGLVTFKNPGTVTIMVSPDSEDVIEGILKMVNYVYALDNTGTLDTNEIAGYMIDYMGLDINRNVLAGLLDAAFAVKDITQDAADPVQLTATAVEIIANIVLQMAYNDTIEFTLVEADPINNFNLEGASSVREGSQIQLEVVDVDPDAGDKSSIVWSSSDPSIAKVDPETGVITGLDAKGSLGQLSTQNVTIYATVYNEDGSVRVQKNKEITVVGKTGRFISDVVINGEDTVEIGTSADYTYSLFPSRVAEAENLYVQWGVVNGEDEDGNPVYVWASADEPATIRTTGGTSAINGDIDRTNTVTINGETYTYSTIEKSSVEAYNGNGAKFSATVTPENATNKNLRWVIDNDYYKTDDESDDTHSISVKQKAAHEVADTFNIYAVSEDGKVKSNTITVCICKNKVTANRINESAITVTNGGTADVTHTLTFEGSSTDTGRCCYKCNWYSSDESVFTVETKTNSNRDGQVTGVDVGTATLYCVSADGGFMDSVEVTVLPDKTILKEIIDLCENTVILRTKENKKQYQQYVKRLGMAYSIYNDQEMASQTTVDTYAQELLTAFYKLGGFVGVNEIEILGTDKTPLEKKFVSVKVGSTSNYTKYSYDLDYATDPEGAMFSKVEWTSSNSSITVDANGVCTPSSNDACAAKITCKVTDYMGNSTEDSVYVAFGRTLATGVALDTTTITGGKVGTTQQLTATVSPTNVLGNSSASCDDDLIWTSSDEDVATVDGSGVVSFVAGGYADITVTTMDGGYTATCNVNVVTNYDALATLIQKYTDLQLRQNAYYPDTWDVYAAAMDKAQAMIDKGGYSQKEVDAMYATLEAAYEALRPYNFLNGVELFLDGEPYASDFYQFDANLITTTFQMKNASMQLNVILDPVDADYATVEWTSSTSDISVTTTGLASPTENKACYGRITCTVTDHFGNSYSDSVWLSFAYFPVTALVLSETNISGAIGGTHQLACTVEPTGTVGTIGSASIKDYYWESDDESVATVDENGLVTFVDAGLTTIRAVSYDGGISGECTVSTNGDRTALTAAIEQYKDVDYMDYEYAYGQAFKTAYDKAVAALRIRRSRRARLTQRPRR